MNKQHYAELMNCIFPGFFAKEYIRRLPDECICDEMILSLNEFDPHLYEKKMTDSISFGYYRKDPALLKEAVAKVEPNWVQYYNQTEKVYCGYIDGKIASFCLITDMGVHTIDNHRLKVGGPGCVGTLPEYRNQGIGLTMIKKVTQILQAEGYDYSYIHYTGVASWYAKLGYQIILRWNKNGIL